MTNEQSFLIQVLSDFINQKKTVLPERLNADLLADCGKKHEVSAIIYYQTKLPAFLADYSSTLYFNTNRRKMLQEVTSALKVPYFIIKGSEVAEYYPVPLLRTMGDIDLVVHTENREKIHDILLNKGFRNISKSFDREWMYDKNDMEVELHDRLMYNDSINHPKQAVFFNNFWSYVKDNKVDINFHFLYLIVHLRKHFMVEGVGFRQFMDVAVMTKYADLDWKWIEKKAEEIELLPFMRTVLAFCNRWFEVTAPIALPKLEESFYVTATNKIFDDGVFGFSNENNEGSEAVNLHWQCGKLGMIGNAMRMFFPSYITMVHTSDGCEWLEGRKYLLPVAWAYRAVKGIKNYKRVLYFAKKSFASSEQIASRESFYKQWGL